MCTVPEVKRGDFGAFAGNIETQRRGYTRTEMFHAGQPVNAWTLLELGKFSLGGLIIHNRDGAQVRTFAQIESYVSLET